MDSCPPRKLDQSGSLDVLGEVSTVFQWGESAVDPVEDERRHLYRTQE
jgi:hypothetical protein